MKKIIKYIWILWMLHLTDSFALDCFVKSPSYAKLGTKYFEYDGKDLGAMEKQELESFLAPLLGEWEGVELETICRGVERSPRKVERKAKIEANISSSNKSFLRLEIGKRYIGDGVSKKEIFNLLYKGVVTNVMFSKDMLSSSEKRRFSVGYYSSRTAEIFTEVGINKKNIIINIMRYDNGVYVSQENMKLDAR